MVSVQLNMEIHEGSANKLKLDDERKKCIQTRNYNLFKSQFINYTKNITLPE